MNPEREAIYQDVIRFQIVLIIGNQSKLIIKSAKVYNKEYSYLMKSAKIYNKKRSY